jgi:GMP synthase PP-ATPase subunit
VFVEHGLLRLNEAETVVELFRRDAKPASPIATLRP